MNIKTLKRCQARPCCCNDHTLSKQLWTRFILKSRLVPGGGFPLVLPFHRLVYIIGSCDGFSRLSSYPLCYAMLIIGHTLTIPFCRTPSRFQELSRSTTRWLRHRWWRLSCASVFLGHMEWLSLWPSCSWILLWNFWSIFIENLSADKGCNK